MLTKIMNFIVPNIGVIVAGIISGVVASFIFHLTLKSSAPKIKISSEIAKRRCGDKYKYYIKLVDLKRGYVVDMKPFLYLMQYGNGPGGMPYEHPTFTCRYANCTVHLPGFHSRYTPGKPSRNFPPGNVNSTMWKRRAGWI